MKLFDRRSIPLRRRQIQVLGLTALGACAAAAGVTRALETNPRVAATVPAAAHPYLADDSIQSGVRTATWDLPNLHHERVDYWVERFTTDKRDEFARFLERMGRYEEMISTRLAERGMPQDLIYLAMIESGFNPTAYSPADASGLWQFIEETGERYGLDVNRAVDERNDPELATDAALTYLSELYDRFGSWYLAAAAYNTGENRVGRIMVEETGSERGTDASYYEIWDRLPKETRDYVPLMIAAARIAKDPAAMGFGEVRQEVPMRYTTIAVAPATPLADLAARIGTTPEAIQELNPQLKLERTRNDEVSYLRVPGSPGEVAAD